MNKTTDQVLAVLRTGASVSVDGSRTTEQLIAMATAARQTGAQLIVRNASERTTEQLISIAMAGGKGILFEL